LRIGARGAAALMLSEQKFFGSFFQKRTACFFLLARLGYGSTIKAAGITPRIGDKLALAVSPFVPGDHRAADDTRADGFSQGLSTAAFLTYPIS
jgi:hypothetical protein